MRTQRIMLQSSQSKHKGMSKKCVTSIHFVEFCGNNIETTVTNDAAEAEDWIKRLLQQNGEKKIIAMDCKYIHHPIESMSNKIALLQLCVDSKCLMLQLLHIDCISQFIRDFLCGSNVTFAGVQIQEKSMKLLNEYELNLGRKIDVHFLAEAWYPVSYKGRPTLKALAYGIAGVSMRKSKRKFNYKGNWESSVLDVELVERACIDVYASYCIAHKLFKDDM